jgi:nicotinate-nucleotide--dimethylbenzimidazole phosphoribosyltransferase
MVRIFLNGGTGINVLSRPTEAMVKVVAVGVDHDFGQLPGLV